MAFGHVPTTPEETERLMSGVEDLRKKFEERKLNIGIYTVEKFF